MSNIYIFYNKNNLNIITTVNPNSTVFDIEDFKKVRVEFDPNYKGMKIEDIGCAYIDSVEHDFLMSQNINSALSIDPLTKEVRISVLPKVAKDNENLLYNHQLIKRDYSIEQIKDIYYGDYINFNLKNIAVSKVLDVKFVLLKDLTLDTNITEVRWDSFFTDPFLKQMGNDKLVLGRDIVKRGTYYPITVSNYQNTDGKTTVLDGKHRVMSLKLLQFMGEIPDDFKMLCIYIPEDCNNFKEGNVNKIIDFSVKTRHIFETKYGSAVINDVLIKNKAMENETSSGGIFKNDYTIEFETNEVSDLIFGIHSYPLWTRDLIFPYSELIEPSIIINNEEEFLKWIKGE